MIKQLEKLRTTINVFVSVGTLWKQSFCFLMFLVRIKAKSFQVQRVPLWFFWYCENPWRTLWSTFALFEPWARGATLCRSWFLLSPLLVIESKVLLCLTAGVTGSAAGSGSAGHVTADGVVTSSASAANANLLAMLAASQQQQQLMAMGGGHGMASGSASLAYGAAFPSGIDLVSYY